jgi:GH25 family lysozyme M1 (1,4-beta-N-acetylmuramidase)
MDQFYSKNVAGCKANNIPFGSYAYAKFVSVNDAEQEAHDFLSRIDKATKFLVLDAEEMTVRDSHDLIPAIQRFIDICKQAGYKTGLYTGEYFLKNYGLSVIQADFIWLAKYSTNKPSADYHLWQYTDKGNVDGISTAVDMNQLGSKPLSYFTGINDHPIIAQVRVIASALNIRQGPGPQYPVITVAPKGKVYNVTGNLNDWHEVIVDDHTKGYAYGNNGTYLELIR